MNKQVEKRHYEFARYLSPKRWASTWHQVDEVLALTPETVLEVGPGPGVFKALASQFGMKVETLDIDPELHPDHLDPADDMPFENSAFDVVCSFQMLEHVPYKLSLAIFSEMARVAKLGVVISLPDARVAWPYSIHVPGCKTFQFCIMRPRIRLKEHVFDGEHHWEINKAGYPLSTVQNDLIKIMGPSVMHTYRVNENPYHRFFVFKKIAD